MSIAEEKIRPCYVCGDPIKRRVNPPLGSPLYEHVRNAQTRIKDGRDVCRFAVRGRDSDDPNPFSEIGWGAVFAKAIYPSPDLPNARELQAAYARGWDDAARRAEGVSDEVSD